MVKLRYETLLFYVLTFDMEAPFESLSLNIMNGFGSYIEQTENPARSLQFYDLFRERIVCRKLQCNLPYLELQPYPDMGKNNL